MAKMNLFSMTFVVMLVGVVGAIQFDILPTKTVVPQVKTIPPSEDSGNWQYVETVYKETNHLTMVHTIEPLQPSYEVKYHSTEYSTINNETISTSNAEFATILNSTVLYNSEALQNYTYNGAPTYYQTMEFKTQRVKYTPVSEKTFTNAVTVTESNGLPLF